MRIDKDLLIFIFAFISSLYDNQQDREIETINKADLVDFCDDGDEPEVSILIFIYSNNQFLLFQKENS